MTMFHWLSLAMMLSLTYLNAYQSGFNNGYDTAVKYDGMCQHGK